MNKTILLISKIITLTLIALAVIFQIIVLIKGEDGLVGSSVLDNYSLVAFIALGIALVLAVVFAVMSIIQNPKSAVKAVGAIVGLVVLGFICYSISTNTFTNIQLEDLKTTADVSKSVGAALYFTYIIGGLAVASIIFSGIAGMFK